jgi:RNA polymerase sigma-70 factor (ECF subfamily)
MLGEHAEAEDVVQDAFLRWNAALATTHIEDDRAYLRTTVTRLCIDRMRSARARREVYVGPWLPEPLVTARGEDPEAEVTLADDVSFALLLALERLSALERAAFLLHDVMGVPFAEIAATLERSEDAVRQLAARAREHVREPRARRTLGRQEASRLRGAFAAAIRNEDLAALQQLLADDVVFVSDSGGKVPSAMVPVTGPDRVGRMLIGISRKAPAGTTFEAAAINGSPGFILADVNGIFQTVALDIAGDRIAGIYVTRNPDKLRAISRQATPQDTRGSPR